MIMPNILKEVRALQNEGKLHAKLIFRVRMLYVISLILGGVVVFNLIFRGVHALIPGVLALIGFGLGYFVFTRMSVVNWNEESETVQAGRMDLIGYGVLALYVAFEIGLRTFLKDAYPTHVTVYLLAGIFGTLLGRAIGTIVEIHRVYLASHALET